MLARGTLRDDGRKSFVRGRQTQKQALAETNK